MNAAREKPAALYDGRRKKSPPADSSKKKLALPKIGRRTRLAIIGLAVPIGLATAIIYSSIRVPAFYQAELAKPESTSQSDGARLEQAIANFHNDVQAGGDWQLELDGSAINGWLAAHLEKKFPGTTPKRVHAPRIEIANDQTRVYFGSKWLGLTIIVQGSIEWYLTDQPNVVAARILGARTGLIPIPLTKWLNSVSNSIARTGIKVRWSQEDAKPLALLTIPERLEQHPDYLLSVLSIEQTDNKLLISGTMNYSPPTD